VLLALVRPLLFEPPLAASYATQLAPVEAAQASCAVIPEA
jgi:hypothetical protein